ncbi:helix-turn-helix domain-containing protein [Helicobacter sp. MIT 05-5293]|uniref:helix-turn-helix domain-containing protein n=1 Tax=unclassified Helicobacter TaxID=2593540 RepID=UPI00068DD958|nr:MULTISPECIES: helix-turn-helix domain-containing protein [unclassified Helicobacter]TLD79829.1 helix-turn-helix domain-containing protein [Helicobacter sp. MIT 05-5293]TLD85540.1 helix-turn-helix domain-containing protein [Helicobacter sp. MIT 05-5294]
MIANKNEIKGFYLTHDMSPKDTAAHFNISYRTLMHWIKTEKWERGGAIKNIHITQQAVFKDNANKVIDIAQAKIKNEIRANLGELSLDKLVENNLLETSTDEVLLKAMNLNYIQKNIALSAIIAKDSMLRMLNYQREQGDIKNEPTLILCAEKTARLFMDMQQTIYGKNTHSEEKNTNDLASLSIAELKSIIEQ